MADKDWTGNSKSIYATLGASNHTDAKRAKDDWYATEPRAMELLLDEESFSPVIWECACGEGHLGKVLEDYGYTVIGTDLTYRGYGEETSVDFLNTELFNDFCGDIITNPPYKYAQDFVTTAIGKVQEGHKVAMFLKLQFLEGKARRKLFDENPPKVVYVSSSRLKCAPNGKFENCPSSAVCYAWFVWEKGFKGEPIIKWIN